MKQLVILSGKGGTGKTTVAAAFAHLAHVDSMRMVLADADVDAANLELVITPITTEAHDFVGGSVAEIHSRKCDDCGVCVSVCRFDAVQLYNGEYSVDPIACDGCAACVYQCPTNAIQMKSQVVGRWFRSETRYGPLFHAALRPAQENSGKLVTLVKQQARLLALDEGYPVVIVDGPPGIGCPVISAASGADLALIVTEPTVAGIHDMERALETTAHFRVPSFVCINKMDLYPAGTKQIEAYCREHAIEIAGRIPFDQTVTEALVNSQPVTEYCPDAPAKSRAGKLLETGHCALECHMSENSIVPVTFKPIGIIHSPFVDLEGMPIQPIGEQSAPGVVEVYPEFVEGLKDLDGFSHIYLIYYLHMVRQSKLTVKPFLDNAPHGVLATRSPSRPNPIGLSLVKLVHVEGNQIHVACLDILDQTPLLDIKPYVPEFEELGEVRTGWLAKAKGKAQQQKSDARFK